MANDLFSGFGSLGGLMKGLSGFMPQDDPDVQLMNAQNEVGDLKAQETALYTEIGKLAFEQQPDAFPAQANKIRLIRTNLAEAEARLNSLTQAKQAAEQAAQAAADRFHCPNCGEQNPEGVKFCRECGSKLDAGKAVCMGCGQENPPGTRFCGGCGARLSD